MLSTQACIHNLRGSFMKCLGYTQITLVSEVLKVTNKQVGPQHPKKGTQHIWVSNDQICAEQIDLAN